MKGNREASPKKSLRGESRRESLGGQTGGSARHAQGAKFCRESIYAILRTRIRAVRESMNLSAKEAARRAGLPPSSYSSAETGGHQMTLESLHRIVEALEISVSEIWPSSARRANQAVRRPARLAHLLRMQQLCLITGSQSACLIVVQNGSFQVVSSINTPSCEKRALLQAILQWREVCGWTIIPQQEKGRKVLLCLKPGKDTSPDYA